MKNEELLFTAGETVAATSPLKARRGFFQKLKIGQLHYFSYRLKRINQPTTEIHIRIYCCIAHNLEGIELA